MPGNDSILIEKWEITKMKIFLGGITEILVVNVKKMIFLTQK